MSRPRRGGRTSRLIRKELREILRDRRTIFTLVLMPMLVYPMLNLVFQRYLLTNSALASPREPRQVVIGFESRQAAERVLELLREAQAIKQYREAMRRRREQWEQEQRQQQRLQQQRPDERTETPQPPVEELRESQPVEIPNTNQGAATPDAAVANAPGLGEGGEGSVEPGAVRPAPQADPRAESPFDGAVLPEFEWKVCRDVESELRSLDVDLAIRLPRAELPMELELLHREQSDRSREALDLVESALNRLNLEFYRRLTPRPLRRPPLTESRRVAIAGETGARVTALGSLVPLILIMMTVTGAVYPSIDLTAGERERSTLETLLAAPVSRFRVLIAKYVAVVTVALLTATVNLGAMTATVYAGGLSELVFGKSGLDLQTILAVFALLVIFAAFFSAVLLMITSSARSFKEAQAYLIPLMLVSLGPGLISLLPDIELQSWLSAAPLINVVLLARDLFQGVPLRWPAMVALGSTVVYATLALAAAAQVFGKDAVSQAPSTPLRGKGGIATAPSPRGAMLTLVLLSPLYYWVGGLVYQIAFRSQSSQLVFSALATAILFAGVPMLACGVERVRLSPGFRLRRPPLLSLPAALLLGLSIWPFAHQLVLLGQQLGMYDLSIARLEQVRAHLSAWRALPLPLLLATLAAAPALFEELFFRGFLFRALERKWSARSTVLVTAVLFGGFHVVSGRLLTPERFMPSTLIGLFLGFLAWRTASVWPGVLAHFCNNAVLLSMAYYKDELMQSGIDVQQQQSLPGHWLLAAIIACAVGVGLLLLVCQPAEEPKS